MNADDLKSWLAIALGIIAILGHAKGFFSSGEKKIADDVKELEDKQSRLEAEVSDQGRRIQVIENEMTHLPDKDSQHRIEMQLERLSGRMEVITESLKPIKANNELLRDLLEKQVTK